MSELNYVDGVTSSIQTQINTNTPTGMISIHAGATAPTGWLLCDGTSYASASYTALFSVVGYTFGGSGANFNVPNLKGRVVVGIDGSQTQFDIRGETGGAMTHQHDASNSGNTSIGHDHTVPALSGNASNAAGHDHTIPGLSGLAANVAGHDHTITVTNNNSGNHGHSDNFGTASGGSHNHTSMSVVQNIAGGNKTNVMDDIDAGSHSHTVNGAVSAGGDHSHTNTAANTAAGGHSHNVATNASATSGGAGGHGHTIATNASATTGGAGGSHSHTTPQSTSLSNLQPYMALNYIIKF